MRRLHHCAALLAFAAVAVCCACASADDKKEKPAFTGTWAKKDGNLKFECCDKNVIKFYPHGDKANFTIVCAYTLEKDGTVKAKITDFEGKAELVEKAKQVVPAGTKFSFKYTIKDDAATLEDVKGDNVDPLKSHLEGEYEKK